MSVVQPVEMVEIRLMNKRVSPTGQRGRKNTPLAVRGSEKKNFPKPPGDLTHTAYMKVPSTRKVPALISANLAVFAFTTTSMHPTILENAPRARVVFVFFLAPRWRSTPMTPTHDTP